MGDTETPEIAPPVSVPLEELRLALVLNGGVSLAVWMGGVARELDAVTRSNPDGAGRAAGPYAAVLELARAWASIDVISGTSAGGINGACLALSQANDNADIAILRDLWTEQGQLDNLLRSPFQGQPSSLLRGDDYFLPALTRAMRQLTTRFAPTHRPLDVRVTTTLLSGALSVTTDDLGQALPQRHHGATFRFSTAMPDGEDDFAPERVVATSAAMALAARCTAGFPIAFEPSFVPVHEDVGRAGARRTIEPPGVDRPDMSRHASWAASPSHGAVALDRSRFTVDGGVLANTPTREALEAIDRRSAERPMRRLMLLVYPHAPGFDPEDPTEDPADHGTAPPTVADSLGGLLGSLTSQGALTFVEEIETHNSNAARWRGGRRQVLEQGSLEGIYRIVDVAWNQYLGTRIMGAARSLSLRVARPERWTYARVLEAARAGQLNWVGASGGERLPYVPGVPPLKQVPTLVDGALPPAWGWGTTVAIGLADTAAEIMRDALGVALDEAGPLEQGLAEVCAAREAMRRARDGFDDHWRQLLELAGVTPDPAYWHVRLLCYRRAMVATKPSDAELMGRLVQRLRRPGTTPESDADLAGRLLAWTAEPHAGRDTAAAVWRVVTALRGVTELVHRIAIDERRGPLTRLAPYDALLTEERLELDLDHRSAPSLEPDDPDLRLLTRMLTLDAATWLLADAESPGTSQEIRLAQLSLAINHPFATASRTPDDKIAGSELHRFGGFLKRSWRVNDWVWGRLDAAQMICRLVADPRRLQNVATLSDRTADELIDDLVRTSYTGAEVPTDDPALDVLVAAARAELRGLLARDPAATSDGYLPDVAALAAYPIQQRIVVEELPALASAIRADVLKGGSERSRGQLFLDDTQTLRKQVADGGASAWRRHGGAVLAAFDRAGIGREPLHEEAGSDAMIQTAVTSAAALVTMADSERVGVSAIRPVTRVLRGAALVPYWLVTGLISGSRAARTVAFVGFVLGGVSLTLSLLGMLGSLSSAGATFGAGIVLSALAFAALRTGTLLHGVVLLAPLAPLIALAVQFRAEARAEGGDGSIVSLLTVLGVALGLLVLASLPNPVRSPLATLAGPPSSPEDPHARRRAVLGTVRSALALVAVAAVVGVLVAISTRDPGERWSWLDLFQRLSLDTAQVVTVVALVVAAATGYVRGRGMRRWSHRSDDTWVLEPRVTDTAGVSAAWSAVYGAGYLALAWAAYLWLRSGDTPLDRTPGWQLATVAGWAALGLLLCLGGPFWTTWRARRRVRADVRASPAGPRTDAVLLDELEAAGRLYDYLVKAPLWVTRLDAAPAWAWRGKRLRP